MNKAFFIDRDGVVNSDEGHYYVYKIQDFSFNDDITDALAEIRSKGYKLVLITNQGGVAKGEYCVKEVEELHNYMQEKLAAKNADFDAIYYCPHHSEISDCDCRKPKPGMILQACLDLNIDPAISYLIGDSDRDIQAGKAAGVKTCIKVQKNTSILEVVRRLLGH